MFDFTNDGVYVVANPEKFLVVLGTYDEEAMVRIANSWGDLSNEMDDSRIQEMVTAGFRVVKSQKLFDLCEQCGWGLTGESHEWCEELQDEWQDSVEDSIVNEDRRLEDDDFDDDEVTYSEVYSRAYNHFGNHELALEAASQYPGDFI